MIRFAAPHPTPARAPCQRRRAATAFAVVALAVLLGACGVIAAFVPPISVGDPLGVDGQVVAAALYDGVIRTQSTTHVDTTRTFDVPDLEASLHGFSLASVHTTAGLANEVTLKAPTGAAEADYPEVITITRALIEAQLRDDVNGSVAFSHDIALDLTFERQACTADGCTYGYPDSEALVDVLDLEVTDRSTLEKLVAILVLRETETPNHGTFRVAVEIEAGTPLVGYVATFHLTSTGSTIRIGG